MRRHTQPQPLRVILPATASGLHAARAEMAVTHTGGPAASRSRSESQGAGNLSRSQEVGGGLRESHGYWSSDTVSTGQLVTGQWSLVSGHWSGHRGQLQ